MTRRRGRELGTLIIGSALLLGGPAPLMATDYTHDCRSSDGSYQMWDELLSAEADPKHESIPYTTVRDTVLSEKQGYCLSKGKKFEFEAKSYVRRVRFEREGRTQEIDLLCDLAADGLPAAFTCEQEVVTKDTGPSAAPPPAAPKPNVIEDDGSDGIPLQDDTPEDGLQSTTAIWTHNGSVMRLDAEGVNRVFSYENPRPGMRKAGAKPGDVVFEGRREGNTYTGTATIFSKECGRASYPVRGEVSPDERSVVLTGQVPLIGKGCRITGHRRDVLRFDYVRR